MLEKCINYGIRLVWVLLAFHHQGGEFNIFALFREGFNKEIYFLCKFNLFLKIKQTIFTLSIQTL